MDKKHVYIEKLDLARVTKDNLSVLSLSKWEWFMKHVGFRLRGILADMYGMFTFEPLHNHHLVMSKMPNLAVLAYLSSDRTLKNLGHTPNKEKP